MILSLRFHRCAISSIHCVTITPKCGPWIMARIHTYAMCLMQYSVAPERGTFRNVSKRKRSGSRFEILRRFKDTKLAQKSRETHCWKALGLSMPVLLFNGNEMYISTRHCCIACMQGHAALDHTCVKCCPPDKSLIRLKLCQH